MPKKTLAKQSGFKGIYWNSRVKKWRAVIRHKGKQISIGNYTIKREAIKGLNAKKREIKAELKAEQEIKDKQMAIEKEELKRKEKEEKEQEKTRKVKDEAKQRIKEILLGENRAEKRALFSFSLEKQSDKQIIKKFNLWSKFYFNDYFTSEDAPFHKEMDLFNLRAYKNEFTLINSAFRGASKSARTKLFIAFCIVNDINHYRKYIKILSADIKNSNGFCTDIYNMLLNPQILRLYPSLLAKTDLKRTDSMGNFATTTGIKVTAGTVGQQQRGSLFEAYRPDLIIFDDFENDLTLRSAVKTDFIKKNIEEARTGLAVGGSQIYLCNYISEAGNVHRLIELYSKKDNAKVLKIPILDDKGQPTWDRYPLEAIEEMRKVDLNFSGERMNNPSHSKNIYFDRDAVSSQIASKPIKESKGLKIFKEYNHAHNYAGGFDISGGLGFDSSTSVFIDFSCYPAEVVATFHDNTIKPDVFAYEIKRQADIFGNCLVAPEQNNHGHATIAILKQLDVKIYKRECKASKIMGVKPSEYGWNTNVLTKTQMLNSLVSAIEDRLIIVNDEDIIGELKGYTRDDAIERVVDPRLVTRHFDLLMALAICWQMKDQRFIRNRSNLGRVFKPKMTRRT